MGQGSKGIGTSRKKKPMKARLLIPLTVLLVGTLSTVRADFSTGFETSSGSYTAGSTIVGVDDNGAPGTNAWTALLGGGTLSSAMGITTTSPQSGTQAFQINDTTNAQAYAAYLNLTNTVVNFTQPYKVSFGMNILSLGSPVSNNQIQFYLGASLTDPNGTSGGRYWTELLYNNGKIELYKNATGGTSSTPIVSTSLSLYAPTATLTTSGTFSNVVTNTNGYVTFDITIDPVSKTYTGFQITSTTGAVTDLTSTVNGVTLPWVPNSTSSGLVVGADPAYNLMFVTGTDDIATVNFDNVSISNVPEPAAWALVALSALATFGYRCRRRQ